MSEQPPGFGQLLLEQAADNAQRVDANRRGHVVAEIAILTMLIDAKLVTIEEACQRIELIQSVLPEPYQSDEVSKRLLLLTQFLRDHDKPDKPARPQWTPQVIEGGKDRD